MLDKKTIEKMFEDYMDKNKSIYFGMSQWEKDTDFSIFKAAINLLLPIIQKQDEAIRFYSKNIHWLGIDEKAPISGRKWIRIVEEDAEYFEDEYCGGKLARSTKKEVSEMIKRLGGEG